MNNKAIKQLVEEKRNNCIENIAKRINKPLLLLRGNVGQNVVLKNTIKKNVKIKDFGKNKKNLEKEFIFMLDMMMNN